VFEKFGKEYEEIVPCYDGVPSVQKYGSMSTKEATVKPGSQKKNEEEELMQMIIYVLVAVPFLVLILAYFLGIWCFAPKTIAYSEAAFGGANSEEEEGVIAAKDVKKKLKLNKRKS